jgi:hypothetical protein
MKNLLLIAFLFVSIISFSQSKPDSVKSGKKIDYTLKTDTTSITIPNRLFEELKQIELSIPMLEKRKNEIVNDVLTFNENKIQGYAFKQMNGQKMMFEKVDTIRNAVKPELKKKK